MVNVVSNIDHDLVSSDQGATLQESSLHASEVKKRSLKGVASFLVRTVILTGVAILAQIILGAALTPVDYGIYGIVVTISSFFTIISDVGLASSLIQKKEEPTVRELQTVFTVQQILSWIVCILIFLSAVLLARYGRISKEGVYLAIAFGLSFPIVSLKTISSILLERKLQFDRLVIPAIVETILFNIILIPLALNGYGVMSFTYAVIVKAISGVLIMFVLQRWPMGLAFSFDSFKTLMKVGGAFQLNDMLAKAKDDLFYITVALVIPPAQYGYITWAKQWSRLPYSLTVDNVTAITFPAFSRLQHDPKLLKRAIEKTLFFITLLAFPLLGGIAVMIRPFIHVFTEYGKWEPAVLSLGLFAFGLAFSAFSTPLISTLNAVGKIKESLKMMIFWTVAQWALFPVLFRHFGYESVAIIAAIVAISSLIVVKLVKRDVKFDFAESIWRQTVATVVMIAVMFFTSHLWERSMFSLVYGVVIGVIIFTSLMLILGFEKMRVEIASVLKKS